jgi:hypothetical protein
MTRLLPRQQSDSCRRASTPNPGWDSSSGFRQRRYRALVQQVKDAIARGDAISARVTLEEARELCPDGDDLTELGERILTAPQSAPPLPFAWSRAMNAVTMLIAGVALLVAIEWIRPPRPLPSSRPLASAVTAAPVIGEVSTKPVLAETVQPAAATNNDAAAVSNEPDLALPVPLRPAVWNLPWTSRGRPLEVRSPLLPFARRHSSTPRFRRVLAKFLTTTLPRTLGVHVTRTPETSTKRPRKRVRENADTLASEPSRLEPETPPSPDRSDRRRRSRPWSGDHQPPSTTLHHATRHPHPARMLR